MEKERGKDNWRIRKNENPRSLIHTISQKHQVLKNNENQPDNFYCE
jgi:hypothetical protein